MPSGETPCHTIVQGGYQLLQPIHLWQTGDANSCQQWLHPRRTFQPERKYSQGCKVWQNPNGGFILTSQTANDSSLSWCSLLIRQGKSHNNDVSRVSSDNWQHTGHSHGTNMPAMDEILPEDRLWWIQDIDVSRLERYYTDVLLARLTKVRC